MPSPRPALAALLALIALAAAPAAAAPPASPPAAASPAAQVIPVVHLSVGTGACATPRTDTAQVDNPCWLQLGIVPAVRLGRLELGAVYEGRELLKWVTFGLVRPPAVTMLGGTAGWVFQPADAWRLLAAGEVGWRRYSDFAGTGLHDREGAASTLYLGATGRAALGLRPRSGRADRLEVSVAIRSDVKRAHANVGGVDWSAGSWSFTMALGLVSEW